MDSQYRIFGLRFGLDPILDVIPEAGNLMATGTSLYLFWIAKELSVPSRVYRKMVVNIVIDFLFGAVPILGIVPDLLFRANERNLALIEQFVDEDVLDGVVVE